MAGGFTVRASALRSASGQVAGLQQDCEELGGQVPATLTGLAQAAGGGQLASALQHMAGVGIQRFLDASAVYQHVCDSLRDTADNYDTTEAQNAAQARAAVPGNAR